jgi:hypothetical protein
MWPFKPRECRHVSVRGWCNGLPYFKIVRVTIDGIGQKHAYLETECAKCKQRYIIGLVHID